MYSAALRVFLLLATGTRKADEQNSDVTVETETALISYKYVSYLALD